MFSFMRKGRKKWDSFRRDSSLYPRNRGRRLCLHSLLIIRRGALVFEGQWAPMTSTEKHRLYSSSKSFVSMAIGLLVGDGKLQLSDRVVDFFPEYDQSGMHHWMKDTTIRDLLCMADCHDDTTYNMNKPEPDMDWVRTWFETPPTHKSGTVFQYNTACTLMLCVIVERVAGKNLRICCGSASLNRWGCGRISPASNPPAATAGAAAAFWRARWIWRRWPTS